MGDVKSFQTHIAATCVSRKKGEKKRIGPNRDLNPGPLAPKASIIPLDHQAVRCLRRPELTHRNDIEPTRNPRLPKGKWLLAESFHTPKTNKDTGQTLIPTTFSPPSPYSNSPQTLATPAFHPHLKHGCSVVLSRGQDKGKGGKGTTRQARRGQ